MTEPVACLPPSSPRGLLAAPAIEVAGLAKRFGRTTAVDGVELTVPRGECVGLLGPNGAGKSTTLEILEGLQEPTAGTVRVLGLTWTRDGARLRERVGIAQQQVWFHDRLSVEETLAMFRSFYARALTVEALLDIGRLGEKRRARVGQLSGGQRQRLSIAVALAGDPELIFLDEPTTGLDPQSRRELWETIKGFKVAGRTVILSTHYLEEAQELCDRVIFLDRGRVVAQGRPAALIASLDGGQVIELVASQELAPEVLAGVPTLHAIRPRGMGHTLHVRELHLALPGVLEVVRAQGIALRSLSTRRATLDDVFHAYTGRSLRQEEAA